MNTEALFIFLILLLGLLLCSFLGGNHEGFTNQKPDIQKNQWMSSDGSSTNSPNQYDNYNHYTGGSTELSSGTTYYGPNGTSAKVNTNSNGSQSLQIVLPGSSGPISFTSEKQEQSSTLESYTNYYGQNGMATTFYGPNGEIATIVTTNNNKKAIKVTTSSGTYYYNMSGSNDSTISSTQYYGSTGSQIQQYNGSAGSVTGPQGNTAYYATGPNGNTVAGTNVYADSLPPGIPRSQIPAGQEDLYILKTEVVPPVCPACPSAAAAAAAMSSSKQETCPPCPACARCPEPSFECKKVPNYNAINNDYLPAPVLSDFSQFGM